jgi:hypothetical protein
MRVRQLMPEEADELLRRRVAFYNLWKPLKRRVEEKPLAMCDVTSAAQDDMLKMALRYREREGEIFVMRRAASHHWWYFPKMSPQHVLLLKTYESETNGRARFLGHSAFDDPATPPDAPTRESIEIRVWHSSETNWRGLLMSSPSMDSPTAIGWEAVRSRQAIVSLENRPSGRLAFACWRKFDENPWLQVPLRAALEHVPPLPRPGPEDPGPFSFASEQRVHRIRRVSISYT